MKTELILVGKTINKHFIAGIKDADTVNAAMQPFKNLQHHLTSSRELNAMWKAKIAALGLVFDSTEVKYVPKSTEEAQ